jgi:hypothetical protein
MTITARARFHDERLIGVPRRGRVRPRRALTTSTAEPSSRTAVLP